MATCPACGDDFKSEHGMKIHYGNMEDENHAGSIAMVEVECNGCGQSIVKTESRAEAYERHFCGPDCLSEWRSEYMSEKLKGRKHETVPAGENHPLYGRKNPAVAGPNHPNWKGGVSGLKPEVYGDDWDEVRDRIMIRDNATCQSCGEINDPLHVHHLKPAASFDDPDEANRSNNLLLLCISCHMKIEAESLCLLKSAFLEEVI